MFVIQPRLPTITPFCHILVRNHAYEINAIEKDHSVRSCNRMPKLYVQSLLLITSINGNNLPVNIWADTPEAKSNQLYIAADNGKYIKNDG